MSKKQIKADAVVKTKLHDFDCMNDYIYKKEKKFLKWVIRKEGYYWRWSYGDDYIGLNPPKNCIIKDGKIYEKPRVDFILSSGAYEFKHFNSYEEAQEFLTNLKVQKYKNYLNLGWITVE